MPDFIFSEFICGFRKWWKILQPPNRDMSGTWPPPQDLPDDSNWLKLRRSGRNGTFLVMLGLSWWARKAITPALTAEFDLMAEDVNWALVTMLRSIPGNSAKRMHSDLMEDGVEDKQPRKR